MSGKDASIRRLGVEEARPLIALRREALLAAPLAFASSPDDDVASRLELVCARLGADDGSATFGAFAPELVGMVGVVPESHVKTAHKLNVFGLYVREDARGAGLGRRLMEAVIAWGRECGAAALHLAVAESAGEARGLYESLGFSCWGVEPDALRHGGVSVAEHHLLLRLAAAGRGEGS